MKTNWIQASVLSVLSVLAVAATASAQSTYATPISTEGLHTRGYGYFYDHASTLEEGVLRGLGYLRASTGEMNYLNSLSNINNQEAISRYLDNREKNTEVYFKMRQINRAARAAERPQRLSHEQQVAIARQQAPAGLNPGQYNREMGRLSWPAMLTGEAFAEERVMLERAFAARSPADVGVASAFHGQVRQLTASMEAKLQGHSQLGVSPNEYIAAKKFIQGLTVESQQPMIFGALASK